MLKDHRAPVKVLSGADFVGIQELVHSTASQRVCFVELDPVDVGDFPGRLVFIVHPLNFRIVGSLREQRRTGQRCEYDNGDDRFHGMAVDELPVKSIERQMYTSLSYLWV